ncbi:MAG: CehA/McbA family metallohydrolase [Lachnospiraceae bacterium]|nr:CehA/McbA family metallohydrolase [Lachnospiraceae bacterium]
MFKRLELHNHTTESDASITALELTQHMVKDKVDAFAITDHNTISGQKKIKDIIDEKGLKIGLIRGMELTSYYGHILCLNLDKYVEWEDIDINCPEKLFKRAKALGGLAGVAHPFSYGNPFARGCRFDMKITDYSDVDFIEISNDLEPLHEVNERGLLYWQDLVLKGEKLATTAGMDLHGLWDFSDNFATFIESDKPDDNSKIEEELYKAITTQQTWVSKGPILKCEVKGDNIEFNIIDTGKPGYKASRKPFMIVLTTESDELDIVVEGSSASISKSEIKGKRIVPKLYRGESIMEDLVCVSPLIEL